MSAGYPFPSNPLQQSSTSGASTPALHTPGLTTPGSSTILPSNATRPRYVVAIIDGDADLFKSSLYARKATGGRDAAHSLHQQILEFVAKREGGAPSGMRPKVLTQVFMNQRGLGQYLCSKRGLRVLESPSDLTAFVHGYNNAGLAASIVDTGEEDQSADQAVKLHFDHHIAAADVLLLGGLHSSNNARLLLTYHPLLRDKVVLLETAPGRTDAAYHAVKGSQRQALKVAVSDGELFATDDPGAAMAMDSYYAHWESELEAEQDLAAETKAKSPPRYRLQRSVSAKSALAPILDADRSPPSSHKGTFE